MNAIQNFAFEERLVRVVEHDGEPWFVGVDVCRAIDLQKPENALASLDEDEKYTLSEGVISETRGPRATVVVSEPGVYRLVFRSRKPEAERFKRWLAHDVLPQIRRTGKYAPEAKEVVLADVAHDAPLSALVEAVKLARSLFGKERARALWAELGLPHVPPPSPFHGAGEAKQCLDLLLAYRPINQTVRHLLTAAMDRAAANERAELEAMGIRVSEDVGGFWIANNSRDIQTLFAQTPFADRWSMLLRRLEGAIAGERLRFRGRQTRTTFLPFSVLDEEALNAL